jgi:hypothetical protein
MARLREPMFTRHVCTDQLTVPQVADTIARLAGLSVRPDTDGRLRATLRRYGTSARHIRFG